MRKYRVVISITSVDHKDAEQSEVQIGIVQSDSIAELVKAANGTSTLFAVREPAVEQHDRLVAAQNKEPDDVKPSRDKSTDHHAGG